MAFLFVDRIADFEPGRRARGSVTVDATAASVPLWVVAEAIGQLAGWVGMARVDFRRRPVAALAGEVLALGEVRPGATLDLSVEVERCDEQAVVYAGAASQDGQTVGEMRRCVGPMLPMEEFDDPAAVCEQFARLCSGAEPPHPPDPLPVLPLIALPRPGPDSLRVELRVPHAAPFFAEHFPRKPVFPATLLIDAQTRLARELAVEVMAPGAGTLVVRRVRSVKVRAFTPPGEVLELGAQVHSLRAGAIDISVDASTGGRRIATARVELERVAP